jgi:PHP family Zn ribbon phosphoesterase
MNHYQTDLHIHSVLSPCGDLDMSPVRIIHEALKKKLDIIGITDHNSTRQVELVHEIGKEHGIFVLMGVEVTSREEIHNLAFFENAFYLQDFQHYIDTHLQKVKNSPHAFGYQLVVNREETIEYEEEWSLASALNVSLEELARKVHELKGIFIPAHIDRARTSIYSQLGFFPSGLEADALEISWRVNQLKFLENHPEIGGYTLVTNSDAHFPNDIGRVHNIFRMKNRSFDEIRKALGKIDGREVISR